MIGGGFFCMERFFDVEVRKHIVKSPMVELTYDGYTSGLVWPGPLGTAAAGNTVEPQKNRQGYIRLGWCLPLESNIRHF